MIDRYSLPEIANIFSDESRFARYLEIKLLATEAQSRNRRARGQRQSW